MASTQRRASGRACPAPQQEDPAAFTAYQHCPHCYDDPRMRKWDWLCTRTGNETTRKHGCGVKVSLAFCAGRVWWCYHLYFWLSSFAFAALLIRSMVALDGWERELFTHGNEKICSYVRFCALVVARHGSRSSLDREIIILLLYEHYCLHQVHVQTFRSDCELLLNHENRTHMADLDPGATRQLITCLE